MTAIIVCWVPILEWYVTFIGISSRSKLHIELIHCVCLLCSTLYFFFLATGSSGSRAASLPEGVTTGELHKALGLAPPPSGSGVELTAKAWHNALGSTYPSSKPLTLTQATPAFPPARISLPIKLPVLDPRLCSSSSKVLPILPA